MKDTVYTTVEARFINTSVAIYFSDILGYEPNDIVDLIFYKKGQPLKKHKITKRVVKLGDGRGCYINKSCGVEKGDILVVCVRDANRGKDDTGIKTEEGFEESVE